MLKMEANSFKCVSLAKSTQSAYRSHLRAYLRFCVFFGCVPVPADNDTLCCYVAFLARSLSSSSISSYMNIIRILHLDAGLPNPIENNWEVMMIKRGVSRVKGVPPKQKMPITLEILRDFFVHLDHVFSPFDKSFWAACLVAFYGFFRKSTILPVSATSPPGICRLDVINFSFSSFEIVVKHSKTIQFGQRTHTLPFAACADPRLCPVRALWSHLSTSPTPSSHHLFAYRAHGRIHLLTHSVFVKKLKELIVVSGRSPSEYSAHSFRRGGVLLRFLSTCLCWR